MFDISIDTMPLLLNDEEKRYFLSMCECIPECKDVDEIPEAYGHVKKLFDYSTRYVCKTRITFRKNDVKQFI